MNFEQLAIELGRMLKNKKYLLVTAESCTGGWIAEAITSVAGSSAWFERGFVTYSNDAKQEMLGVNIDTLKKYGAVSEQVAKEMAAGALQHSHADISIAVTGIAGPDGGTAEKPVGLVWFGFASKNFSTISISQVFLGDRRKIREQAVIYALNFLLEQLKNS